MRSSKAAVASFPVEEQEAMSPAPTSTAVGELAWLAARETTARRAAHNTHTMSPRHREVMTVGGVGCGTWRSEEHTSELQSRFDIVCRLLLEKKKLRSDVLPRHGRTRPPRLQRQ